MERVQGHEQLHAGDVNVRQENERCRDTPRPNDEAENGLQLADNRRLPQHRREPTELDEPVHRPGDRTRERVRLHWGMAEEEATR